MENQNIELKVNEGVAELVTRTGAAQELPPLFPQGSKITGIISTASEHLKKHSKWLLESRENKTDSPLANSFVKVDRALMTIEFIEDYGNPWSSSYKGKLELDERFKRFTINESKSYTPFELSNLIKMNRSFFETKDKAMLLVSQLRGFKANVDKQVESEQDERANKKVLIAQAVDTNLPENFYLSLPVFKGTVKINIEVEISIDPQDLSCRLVSPEVEDYIESHRDELMDNELDLIKELHPELRIFEI